MDRPLFSIITPTYNHGQYLEKMIKSVQSQGTCDIEHLIIDGDSTDCTTALLKEYEGQYNLRWISESDRGQAHALNKGIQMAKGSYIGWQNADDYYLPETFDTVRSLVESYPDADMIYGDIHIVNESGSETNKRHFPRPSRLIQRYLMNFMANQSAFIKSEFFDAVGLFNENYEYAMDTELFWKLLNYQGKYIHVPEYFAAIRVHENMKSVANRDSQKNEGGQILQGMDRKPYFEQKLPNFILEQGAIAMMAFSLLRDGRYSKIIKYMLK